MNQQMQHKYKNYTNKLEDKNHRSEHKIQTFESKPNTMNTSTYKPKRHSSPKPTPWPSPTMRKMFGPTKSPSPATNAISQYFQNNNLKFEHQGDEYYLQTRILLKTHQKSKRLIKNIML